MCGDLDAGWLRARLAASGLLPDVVREAGEIRTKPDPTAHL